MKIMDILVKDAVIVELESQAKEDILAEMVAFPCESKARARPGEVAGRSGRAGEAPEYGDRGGGRDSAWQDDRPGGAHGVLWP